MKKLEKHPFFAFIIIILVIIATQKFVDNKTEFIAISALFLGTAGFVNSLYLNKKQ